VLEGLLRCSEHDCPMIHVGDDYCCLFEYVDERIGGQQLVDVTPGADDAPLTLVFGNGRRMPLYCPDCGGPLLAHPGTTREALQSIAGWYLYSLGYAAATDEAPEYLELVLTPSFDEEDDTEPADDQSICVHLRSAREIR
jgi:hypothetical protein